MHTKLFLSIFSLAHMYSVLDIVLIFCAVYLPYIVIVVVALYLFFHNHNRSNKITFQSFVTHTKELVLVTATASAAWLLSALLKYNIEVARPFLALPITPLLTHGGLDSFPSGHATFFMALAVALFYHHKRAAVLVAINALIIGFARIAVGVHFPFDILVGWVLGIVLGILIYKLWIYLRARFLGKRT